jgi:hypothetical protein
MPPAEEKGRSMQSHMHANRLPRTTADEMTSGPGESVSNSARVPDSVLRSQSQEYEEASSVSQAKHLGVAGKWKELRAGHTHREK